jgi:hypothetical protein
MQSIEHMLLQSDSAIVCELLQTGGAERLPWLRHGARRVRSGLLHHFEGWFYLSVRTLGLRNTCAVLVALMLSTTTCAA